MNKADLIDRIAASCHISKTQAATAIDTTVDSITSALKKGDRVALIGFGTFSVSQRKARNGARSCRFLFECGADTPVRRSWVLILLLLLTLRRHNKTPKKSKSKAPGRVSAPETLGC
jgi:hypothetical protein